MRARRRGRSPAFCFSKAIRACSRSDGLRSDSNLKKHPRIATSPPKSARARSILKPPGIATRATTAFRKTCSRIADGGRGAPHRLPRDPTRTFIRQIGVELYAQKHMGELEGD